jgi:hypothetical protein
MVERTEMAKSAHELLKAQGSLKTTYNTKVRMRHNSPVLHQEVTELQGVILVNAAEGDGHLAAEDHPGGRRTVEATAREAACGVSP